MDEQLKELEAQIKAAEVALTTLRHEKEDVGRAIAERDFGVKPGVLVRSGGDVYEVTDVRAGWKTPHLKGRKQLKDGTFSTKLVNSIYGTWELIE